MLLFAVKPYVEVHDELVIAELLQRQRRQTGSADALIGRRRVRCHDGHGLRRLVLVELAHEIRVGIRAHTSDLDAQAFRQLELTTIEAEQVQETRRLKADGIDRERVVKLRDADRQALCTQLSLHRRDDALVFDVDEWPCLLQEPVEIVLRFVLDEELGAEIPADADDESGHEEIAHIASFAPT